MAVMESMVHMNGGEGDTSYAHNSLLQKKAISMTWSIIKQAITDLCSGTFPTTLTMADLGCSSGPNTFMVVSNLIKEVEKIRQNLQKKPFEYQILLNDLPGNDFNTIFRFLPGFLQNLKTQIGHGVGPCLFNGVPGSFYGRLFPSRSVHFVHSSYSLQWLSQIPKEIESENKGNIFMASSSPRSVIEAYYRQFQKDFSMFLKCRGEEMVSGGKMVLTILGRTTEDGSSKECCNIWGLLTSALMSMVSEGIVEEEKVDSFNIPNYFPSPWEVETEVLNEGSFAINGLQVSRINWNFYSTEFNVDSGYNIAKCIRAVAEPLLVHHFGEAIIDELFCRYTEMVVDLLSKEQTEFINITVSLTRKQ